MVTWSTTQDAKQKIKATVSLCQLHLWHNIFNRGILVGGVPWAVQGQKGQCGIESLIYCLWAQSDPIKFQHTHILHSSMGYQTTCTLQTPDSLEEQTVEEEYCSYVMASNSTSGDQCAEVLGGMWLMVMLTGASNFNFIFFGNSLASWCGQHFQGSPRLSPHSGICSSFWVGVFIQWLRLTQRNATRSIQS